MRITITGATGMIGSRLTAAALAGGDEVTVLSRDPRRARSLPAGVEAIGWDPSAAAPAAGLSGRDAVIHLAGEPIAQRWTAAACERIRSSREDGTRNLVAGLEAADPRPRALVSASAVGYYGARGDEPLTEEATAGEDFLAQTCVIWERAAQGASRLDMRVVTVRAGVVLDRRGGALSKMLLPFRLGVGGPVAGGRQYLSWIHVDDLLAIYLAAAHGEEWSGPVNATAPEPATNREFSKALGRALHRPAVLPVPAVAIRALYGDMALIVTTGQRVIPRRALTLGYQFRHSDLDAALRDALVR